MIDRRAQQHRNLVGALAAASYRAGRAEALGDRAAHAHAESERDAARAALLDELARLSTPEARTTTQEAA